MRSSQHPCRHFKTILQPFACEKTLTDLAAKTMVSPSDEDLLTVEVVPRIANYLHLVLWGIVLCTFTTAVGPIWDWTKMPRNNDEFRFRRMAKSSRSPMWATCTISTNAWRPEVKIVATHGSNTSGS